MKFQPTPSSRRATVIVFLPHVQISRNFNPRPPRGGRQHQQRDHRVYRRISTHALLAEGDRADGGLSMDAAIFHPPPSSRWATPTPTSFCSTQKFQPTPSSRRATFAAGMDLNAVSISTHALLAEGDNGGLHQAQGGRRISTHALLAEGDAGSGCAVDNAVVISTHALLAEGDPAVDPAGRVRDISTHALLAEGDYVRT